MKSGIRPQPLEKRQNINKHTGIFIPDSRVLPTYVALIHTSRFLTIIYYYVIAKVQSIYYLGSYYLNVINEHRVDQVLTRSFFFYFGRHLVIFLLRYIKKYTINIPNLYKFRKGPWISAIDFIDSFIDCFIDSSIDSLDQSFPRCQGLLLG